MVKQPGQLATIMVSAGLTLSLLHFVAPKTKVESFLVQDLVLGVVVMVTMPAIIIQRNDAMSNFVFQKYFVNNIFTKFSKALNKLAVRFPGLPPRKVSDTPLQLQC